MKKEYDFSKLKELKNPYPSKKKPVGKLSYTHRKEYCRWITEAKKEETRLKRLEKAIEMLKQRVSTPG
jgi:uncharacterized protein YdeI (YjbR/CyaY-like superfamily)